MIRDLLNDGPMESAALERKMRRELGVSEKTFKAARKEAGVGLAKEAGRFQGRSICSLTEGSKNPRGGPGRVQ